MLVFLAVLLILLRFLIFSYCFVNFFKFIFYLIQAVNVDDAVDDIVRQFKGVSNGLMRKVVGSPTSEASSLFPGWNLSGNADETDVLAFRQNTAESTNSFSDNEEGTLENGWHSDNELNYKGYPPRVVHTRTLGLEKKADLVGKGGFLEDPIGMPPEVLLMSSEFILFKHYSHYHDT